MIESRYGNTDQTLELNDDKADIVLDAISNKSAREILITLEDGHATIAELADQTGQTKQNVSYHLNKLSDAEIVSTAGTQGTGRSTATVYTKSASIVISKKDNDGADWVRIGVIGLFIGVFLSVACLHTLADSTTVMHTVATFGTEIVTSLL